MSKEAMEVGHKQTITILGGGITGLAAAFALQERKRETGADIRIRLIEGSHRLGGKVQTVTKDGFVIERGPDSFLARKTSAVELAKKVGLEGELVRNSTGTSYIAFREKLHPMPGGSVMGVPTELSPFLKTKLFSTGGKARAALDLVLPRTSEDVDQSLGHFFRKRLGNEVVERLVEPLLSGIYAGDIDQLSLHSTYPQFYHAEQEHGSLIRGMRNSRTKQKGQEAGTKKGMFYTFRSGLETFVRKLEEALTDIEIVKGTRIQLVEKEADGYALHCFDGSVSKTNALIVTLPHEHIPSLFPTVPTLQSFATTPSTSVATVAMAFPKEAIEIPYDGTGFVVARGSHYTITACTWTHKKWPHSTPEGHILLRCYVGRAGDEAVVDLDDESIVKIALDDLSSFFYMKGDPSFSVVTRWKEGMPQYTVGHRERIQEVRNELETAYPAVFLAGSSFEGVGLPDCITQGQKVANQAWEAIL